MPTKRTKVVVNRKFMLDLAKRIYDPKTKRFTRLCKGTLLNGPDPGDKERLMHCALGELYFAMTGKHPTRESGVSETAVADLAVQLSGFEAEHGRSIMRARKGVLALHLPREMEGYLLCSLDDLARDGYDDNEEEFRTAIADIPNVNDDDVGDDVPGFACSDAMYRTRAARVAREFVEASKLLPG